MPRKKNRREKYKNEKAAAEKSIRMKTGCCVLLVVMAVLSFMFFCLFEFFYDYDYYDGSVSAVLSGYVIEKDGGYIPIRGGRTTYDDQEVYAELKVDTDGSFTKKTVYTHPSGLVEGRDRITILYNKNNPDDYIIKGENNDDPLVAYVFLALELLIVPMLIAAMRATIKERKEFRKKYHISGKE